VRQFLFQVWADVLATAAVRYGAQADQTKAMKRAATDVIWSAGAKVTREERAEVLRRLPPLLKALRDGMASAGMSAEKKQDEHIQTLNNSLAARLHRQGRRHHQRQGLTTSPNVWSRSRSCCPTTPTTCTSTSRWCSTCRGMKAPRSKWSAKAARCPRRPWWRGRASCKWAPGTCSTTATATRRCNWPGQGMRKQLSLFVTPQGRCVLFQQQRLAAFLQAGLLLPAQEESLTVRDNAHRAGQARLPTRHAC